MISFWLMSSCHNKDMSNNVNCALKVSYRMTLNNNSYKHS